MKRGPGELANELTYCSGLIITFIGNLPQGGTCTCTQYKMSIWGCNTEMSRVFGNFATFMDANWYIFTKFLQFGIKIGYKFQIFAAFQ